MRVETESVCRMSLSLGEGAAKRRVRVESERAVIGELQLDPEIRSPQQLDRLLKQIPALRANPDEIALNRGLDFDFALLDLLHDFPGFFDGYSGLNRDLLTGG